MAAVLELYGVFETVYGIYTGGKDVLEKYYRNPELANGLATLFKRLLDEVARLADKCSNNSVQLPDDDLQFYTVRVEELSKNMTDTCDKLQKKLKRLKNRFYRLGRAFSTSDWLSELETNALRADELLRDITGCFVTVTLISQQTDDVKAAIAKNTETVTKAVAAGSEPREQPDLFRPSVDVPDNPPHVVLNLGSASQSEQGVAQPLTIEGKLKSVVLQSDGSQCIGAIGSAVGTEGMSGVGKSCALRGLAKDAEVKQRFTGGIYYVILGKDATEANVVQQLAKIIKASGGTRVAREVLEEGNIDAAVSKARQWFADKCALLLLDDAWKENESGGDVVTRLSPVMDRGQGSRVVFTTRDVGIGLGSESIHFSARSAAVSLPMLLASAGLREEYVKAFRSTVDAVLDVCGGLPMALAVAGSAIRLKFKLRRPESESAEVWGEMWGEYLSDLQADPAYLLYGNIPNYPYKRLLLAFSASLSVLDKNVSEILRFQPLMPFSKMYRALMVLQRQGWLPVSVLERLWDTKDGHETIQVMEGLVSANLAQREDRMVNGKKTAGISLHDLHLSFVRDECKARGESKEWHRKLLGKFLPEEAGSSGEHTSVASRNWCKDEVFADDYIRNNVSRHLVGAGLEMELHDLLRNPRWAAQRLCVQETLPLEDDFGMMGEQLKQEGRLDVGPGAAESLKMISDAARLSSPYVSRNPDEVWFQLRARLFPRSKESDVIRKYLTDIERCAERPWVKALSACLPGPGGALQSTVICDGHVEWISQVDDDGKFMACGTTTAFGKKVFVSAVIGGQLEKTVWLSMRENSSSAGSEDGLSTGSAALGDVSAVCCARDGSRVVTGHKGGAIQLWEAETGEAVGDALVGHSDDVKCVALSADGRRVASGSGDHTVRVWDAETGEAVGDALVGHSDDVKCVALSADGRRVASGSSDHTVRLWDAETGEAVGDALVSHSGRVWCDALSADGRRVASGSEDHTVRVWDAETGEAVGDALVGHSDWVECVALSSDGRRVASGSGDHTVHVWDAETGECLQTEDNWNFGDTERLRFLLREEGAAAAEDEEECRVTFGDYPRRCVKYLSADGSRVLATLEESAVWYYSDVGRRIVSRSGKKINFFELVV